MNTRQIAQITEEYAAFFLVSQGYQILTQNYSSAGGEIDLIAYKDANLHFVEVKGRKQSSFLAAEEALTDSKLEKLEITALAYLDENEQPWQVDFIALTYDQQLRVKDLSLFENLTAY